MNKKIIVLIPAYNTEKDVYEVFDSLKKLNLFYDEIIFCDDGSKDNTLKNVLSIRKNWKLNKNIIIIKHKKNQGYGAAQKTLFKYFLKQNGDIGVLIHSDNQYPPDRIKDLITPIVNEKADIVLASRFYGNMNYHEQMPLHKIIGNRVLTKIENIVLNSHLSEFHTGLRAYSGSFLKRIKYKDFSNKFEFDSEILFDAIQKKFKIVEIPVFAKYEENFSNLNSIVYGLKILIITIKHVLKSIFKKNKQRA